MAIVLTHVDPIIFREAEPISIPWKRMFVLYIMIPSLLVGSAYAFAQLVLVPKIVLGDTVQENSYAATTMLLTQLKLTRGAYAIGTVAQPYLRVPGTLIGVDNDNIQVYEYVSHNAALSQAKNILAKESTLSKREFFHAYVHGNLVILYLGNKLNVIEDLQSLLGSPIDAQIP